jgi:signal peptidase II
MEKLTLYKKMPKKDYILYSAVIILGIIADQVSKIVILMQNWPEREEHPIIDGLLTFVLHKNDGAAWGMLGDHRWAFMSISTVAIIGFSLYIFLGHADTKVMGISMALVTSGGIGNMIDRIFIGEVTDFIKFPFVYYPSFSGGELIWKEFPIFNIADCFVTVGAFAMIFALLVALIKEIKKSKREKREKSDKE